MCGIFGVIGNEQVSKIDIQALAMHARQRGRDSSGLIQYLNNNYIVSRADFDLKKILKKVRIGKTPIFLGHSRLVTNGMKDNQPVTRDGMFVIHNGIIIDDSLVWEGLSAKRQLEIDTEVLLALTIEFLTFSQDLTKISDYIFSKCTGTISAALGIPRLGKLVLLSNNGSLYVGNKNHSVYFSSEEYPLLTLGCMNISRINGGSIVLDIPKSEIVSLQEFKVINRKDLIPKLQPNIEEERMLVYKEHNLKRCTKCILPETFPHITFDENGVCNYCNNYQSKDKQKSKEELLKRIEPYRRNGEPDCIVPFSGGRDSCYALHIIVNELKMKPITYTYDWGMVTDLARRNISRMCSQLGVENIIVAANIDKKRRNIRMNLKAWLKKPHLGMVSILTAGDKHFFKYVETIKKQTGIDLNLWGTNPLETTHFKAGFLGVKPDFEEKRVYTSGYKKQMRYQWLRLKAMLKNPSYFNRSLFDTLSGEYHRSIVKRTDYFHIYDYYRWEEETVNKVIASYGFEKSPDTNTTWRIGDGTAAFYNYIYYTVAGFTEHDTFRSNQIREGHITRDEALRLVRDENQPRYLNIRWYLDTLDMDYKKVVQKINSIPKLYK